MSLKRSIANLPRTFRSSPAFPYSPPFSRQTLPLQRRLLSQTSPLAYPRKDAQDKDSMNVEANEYSKSSTDDEAARREDTAFNPDVTDPQHQHEKEGGNVSDVKDANNPLNVSPANPEISKPRGEQEGGAESSSQSNGTEGRERSSGGGSPSKGKTVDDRRSGSS